MRLKEMLKEKEREYNEICQRILELERQRQLLINEGLRLEGEIRLLRSLLIEKESRDSVGDEIE